jgi:outer membrane biosynthesis protein TonB
MKVNSNNIHILTGEELTLRRHTEQLPMDTAASEGEETEGRKGQKKPGDRKRKKVEKGTEAANKRRRKESPEKEKSKKKDKKIRKTKKKKEAEERRRKKKRGKLNSSSTDSESEDSSSSSSSNSSSSEYSCSSSSEETDSTDERGKKGKGKKARRKKEREDDWQLLAEMWPLEARPARLQDKKVVARWSIGKIMEFKKQYEMEAERQGVGVAVFGRDKKRRAKRFRAMKDNGEDRLHPARFERMPFSDPAAYWAEMPVKREEIYRHIKLDLYGAQGQVSEATIVRLHDRRVPVDLEMFTRNSLAKELKGADRMTELVDTRHFQEAVANYTNIMQVLD